MFKKSIFYPRTNVGMFIMIPIVMLFFISCSSDDDNAVIIDQSIPSYLEGNYLGTWNSETPTVTFTDYLFSSTLTILDNNTLSGSWYGNQNFEVCCSDGDDDGTVTMEFNGTQITSFVFDDVITGCSGVFTGTGSIRESDNALVVDFTGTDCDGLHVGQMIFVKQ